MSTPERAAPTSIVVHRVDLGLELDPGALDAAERARAQRFAARDARRAFIACRVTLRRLLAVRLGLTPQEVRLGTGPYGKPLLADGGLSFSVAHAGRLGLIALAHGEHRVGIDLECASRGVDVARMAQRFLHRDEIAAVGRDRAAFLRCWTRKEAVVKATGRGLSQPLASFAVEVDARGQTAVRGVHGLIVEPLNAGAGYYAAVATDAPAALVWATAQPAVAGATASTAWSRVGRIVKI